MSDGRTGRAGVPETGVPETGVPETGVPETGVPETGVPETGVPETGVPETGAEGHLELEELAAAYVLDALESGEEARFLQHLASCPECVTLVGELRETVLALAEAAPAADPPPDLRSRIVLAALSSPGLGGDDAGVERFQPAIELAGRRDTRPRRLLALAAAACVAVAAVVGGLVATSGSGAPAAPSPCTTSRGCAKVVLTDVSTGRPAATLEESAGRVWVRPTGLRPNVAARQIYVLWEIAGSKPPRPLGGFDVPAGARSLVEVGILSSAYGRPTAFAVSLEPGRAIPTKPSHAVATGKAA